MNDTVVIAEPDTHENTGFRFSWGLAIGGGVIATAVTFILLTLGAGFGLLLVAPNHGASAPTLLTGGTVYFLVAQAFGFAVGGHFAGRLLGPLVETQMQEDIRAGAHALVAWAVAVLAGFLLIAGIGLSASQPGAKTASMYGSTGASGSMATDYTVDRLFVPLDNALPRGAMGVSGESPARREAADLVTAGALSGAMVKPEDHARLVALVTQQTGLSQAAAAQRVDMMQSQLSIAANSARKAASYTSLWIAISLIFGAIVAMGAAVSARIEDDRQTANAVR